MCIKRVGNYTQKHTQRDLEFCIAFFKAIVCDHVEIEKKAKEEFGKDHNGAGLLTPL